MPSSKAISLAVHPAGGERHSPSFVRALTVKAAGLVIALGLLLLAAMLWQGISSTGKAARREIHETLDRAEERLRILIEAAEMTAKSAERSARSMDLTGDTLRPVLENALAAFEQRPELSYLGIVLPETGEYGCLERTGTGEILLWLFPGTRPGDAMTRIFVLTDHGFTLREERPTDGYDPRERPFYRAAVESPSGVTWIPSYPWIVHEEKSEPLWGFSYVKALRDDAGRLIGVLDVDFDLPALNGFLESIAADYRCDLQIVELGETPRLIGDPTVGRMPLPLPSELDLSGESFVGRMEREGERRWTAARRIRPGDGISWLVVASRKDLFIEAPLLRQLYQVLGAGLAVAAGLVLVSIRMARRFGRPLAELERRVADIGSLGVEPAAVSTAGDFRETRLLGEALDRMSAAVRQQISSKEQQVASLALKAAIFDSTGTAIFSLDPRNVIIEWNAASERLFGREHDAAVGHAVAEVVAAPAGPADWDAILAVTGASVFPLAGAHGPFDAELRVVTSHRDGREIHTLLLNDISARQRAEAALRENLDRFHAAARATGDVIWDWDLTTDAIWWNDNYQTLFGYSAAEIGSGIAESWNRLIHPDDRERVISHIHDIIDGTGGSWFDEYRFLRKDGTWAHLLDRGHVLRDAAGRGIRMVGAMQDITRLKEAQDRLRAFNTELEQRVSDRTRELRNLNKELESFCHSVSHDLRAPLRGIAGFTEILAKNHADALDETARNYLGRVLAATHRMGDLIDDLLNLSRVSRDEMRRETVDLSTLARDVVSHLRQADPEREVDVRIEDGLTAEGDSRLLRVMLKNLLNNAWKFTSRTPGARIDFSFSPDEDGAPAFAVSDNGAGFDMRYADKLFGPFQRLHRVTEFPGTGIGLATVQRIVHRHGGHISAHAEPGKGATFRFSL